MSGLTKKQKEVYDFVIQYTESQGLAPTQQEILEHFGFRSLGHVQHFIKHLKAQGLLQGDSHAHRGLGAQKKPTNTKNEIAFLGKVAAGRPLDYRVSNETLEVPTFLTPQGGDFFALQAQGNSMIDAHILDGDFLLIQKQNHANNGDIVIAEVNNEATIKRFFKKKTGIELHPENPEYEIIRVLADQDFRIEGKLVGVLSRRV